MKIEKTEHKSDFKPFVIQIIVESQEDKEMLEAMAVKNITIPEVIGPPYFTKCQSFLSELRKKLL